MLFQVSWIRKSDLHVLTSDVLTFTGDQRFSAHHASDSNSWALQIKYTQLRDAGEYQCQVNTEPKISFSVFLTVKGKLSIIGSLGAFRKKVLVSSGNNYDHCLVY